MKTWQQLRQLHSNKKHDTIMIMIKNNNTGKKVIAARNQRKNASSAKKKSMGTLPLCREDDDSVTSTTTATTTSDCCCDNDHSSTRSRGIVSSLTDKIDSAIVENDLLALRKLLLQQQHGRVMVTGDYIAQALGTAVAEGNVEACRLLFSFINLYGKEKYFVNQHHLGEDCLVHMASIMRHLYHDDDNDDDPVTRGNNKCIIEKLFVTGNATGSLCFSLNLLFTMR
jgi:hypothetical protein